MSTEHRSHQHIIALILILVSMRKLPYNHLLFNPDCNLSRKEEDRLTDPSHCHIPPEWQASLSHNMVLGTHQDFHQWKGRLVLDVRI